MNSRERLAVELAISRVAQAIAILSLLLIFLTKYQSQRYLEDALGIAPF